MPAKKRKTAKTNKKTKKGDNLWCTEDINVDENGDLHIYNTYLCAVVVAAIARAEAEGHNLKIVCTSGGGTNRDQVAQCTC